MTETEVRTGFDRPRTVVKTIMWFPVRLLINEVSLLVWIWRTLQRRHTVRKVLTTFLIGFGIASYIWGGAQAVAGLMLALRFALQVGMMIGQFALLMIFLGSSKTIESVPGDKREITFERDYFGNENEVKLVRQWTSLLTTDRHKLDEMGGKAIAGILLTGPPGVGKTLMARALAGDSHAGFLGVTGSDFMSMWMGMGAFKVMGMFGKARDWARRYGACIVYIDEIDAIAAARGGNQGGAMNPMVGAMGGGGLGVLTKILSEMDGLREGRLRENIKNDLRVFFGLPPSQLPNVLVMAATNRPDVLDPAIMRPGRFDQIIQIGLPDKKTRRLLFEGYLKKIKHAVEPWEVEEMVDDTQGVSHAHISSAVEKDAIRIALFDGRNLVTRADIEHGIEERMLGLANPIEDWDPEQRAQVAYHEAGHAVMAKLVRSRKRISRASIVRRTRGILGYMMDVETKEVYARPIEDYAADVMVALAGHVATKVWCGKEWTGASGDFQAVRNLMYHMASLAQFDRQIPFKLEDPFANEGIKEAADRYLKRALDGTERLLRANWPKVEAVANGLLEHDELDSTQLAKILGGTER